jgi:general secretion pathway protein K
MRAVFNNEGSRRSAAQRGVALILVMWALVLLTLLTASIGLATREERFLAVNDTQQAQALAVAEAAVFRGIQVLLNPVTRAEWPLDGTRREVALGRSTMGIAIGAEAGRINLNYAPAKLLEGALLGAGAHEPARLAAAIVDWRDRGHDRSTGGAEDSDYAGAGRTYGAADHSFMAVAELERVLGMTSAVVAELRSDVTVLGRAPKIDARAATRDVLLSLPGISSEAVDRFIELRTQNGSTSPLPMNLLAGAAPYLSSRASRRRGGMYHITGDGSHPSGVSLRIHAVVMIGGGRTQYQILDWQTAYGAELRTESHEVIDLGPVKTQ